MGKLLGTGGHTHTVSPAFHSCSPVAPQIRVAGNLALPELTPPTKRSPPPTPAPPAFCGVPAPRRVTVGVVGLV
ncbi:hypothetical protein E2C01_014451 [Portunus trituberculatus]|uniref:Uncharacterized protein n=1 Tax=Portunus trituberculatus TaxID=210409 RepID=A0A5B7DJY4_PORTR|nr:hypothetical protein [Portunus trituberculatus]